LESFLVLFHLVDFIQLLNPLEDPIKVDTHFAYDQIFQENGPKCWFNLPITKRKRNKI